MGNEIKKLFGGYHSRTGELWRRLGVPDEVRSGQIQDIISGDRMIELDVGKNK